MLIGKFCEWWLDVCGERMFWYYLGCFLFGFVFGIAAMGVVCGIALIIDRIFGTSLLEKVIRS